MPAIPALGSTDGWIRRLTDLSVSPKHELNPRFRERPGLRKRGEEAMEESTSDGLWPSHACTRGQVERVLTDVHCINH